MSTVCECKLDVCYVQTVKWSCFDGVGSSGPKGLPPQLVYRSSTQSRTAQRERQKCREHRNAQRSDVNGAERACA